MQHILTENLLFIDIETVSEKATYQNLTKNWQELWTEKTQRILPSENTAAEFYEQRAGVMAEFAKVICISIGYFKYEGEVMQLRIKSFYHQFFDFPRYISLIHLFAHRIDPYRSLDLHTEGLVLIPQNH